MSFCTYEKLRSSLCSTFFVWVKKILLFVRLTSVTITVSCSICQSQLQSVQSNNYFTIFFGIVGGNITIVSSSHNFEEVAT